MHKVCKNYRLTIASKVFSHTCISNVKRWYVRYVLYINCSIETPTVNCVYYKVEYATQQYMENTCGFTPQMQKSAHNEQLP